MAKISIALSKGRIFDETAAAGARRYPAEGGPEALAQAVLATNRRDVQLIVVPLRTPDLCRARRRGPRRGRARRAGRARRRRAVPAGRSRHRRLPDDGRGDRAASTTKARCGRARACRVATKYVNITARLSAKGVHLEYSPYGSMELAPLVGLARCDRRSRFHRQHLARQQPSFRSRNHAGVGAVDRQSGGAQDQARARCRPADRRPFSKAAAAMKLRRLARARPPGSRPSWRR